MKNTSRLNYWSKIVAVVALLLGGLTQFAAARWRPSVTGDPVGDPATAPALPPAAKTTVPVSEGAIPPAPSPLGSVATNLTAASNQIPSQQTTPPRPLITQAVDETVLTTLRGNTNPLANALNDRGAAAPDLMLHRILMLLKRTPEQDAALVQLIQDQQDASSPNYKKWLTPDQFGQQFGPADSDIQTVTSWLSSHGFQVTQVTHGKTIIEFSGTAAQVLAAFHTEIHNYSVNGVDHLANASDPQIPSALAPAVLGLVSLHNFVKTPTFVYAGSYERARATGAETQIEPGSGVAGVMGQAGSATNNLNTNVQPEFTSTRGNDLGPTDFATIYNVAPLWAAGIDGTGQTIAIVGRSNVNIADAHNFRSLFGLPANDPQVIINGPDPGRLGGGEEAEANLDIQWSGAVAKGATIKFVISASTETTDGVDLSSVYIVDNNVAPVMSMSFGESEIQLGNAANQFENTLWQQAAAQGITVMISSGDAGSGVEDQGSASATNGLTVSGSTSTPYNVSVGGTDFDDVGNTATFWNATNAAITQASAKSYIPEVPWNGSCARNGISGCTAGSNISTVAGSGGASNCSTQSVAGVCTSGYAKPVWQTGTGVLNDGARTIPDISLFASNSINGTAYVVCDSDNPVFNGPACDLNSPFQHFSRFGGTSASSPAFAGVMALVNQKTASIQGNANFVLYKLAAQPNATCDSSLPATITDTTCIFYDITKGNNSIACTANSPSCSSTTAGVFGVLDDTLDPSSTGIPAWITTAGYDRATGLGTVNVANLANHWTDVSFTGSTTTLNLNGGTAAVAITHGQSVNVTGGVTSGGGTPTGQVSLVSNATGGSGITDFTLSAGNYSGGTTLLPGGSYSVHAHYAGNGTIGASDSGPINVTVAKENAFMGLFLVTLLSNGGVTYTAPTSTAPYGSGYFLHVDVFNSKSQTCQNNPLSGVAGVGCATGIVTITDSGTPVDGGTFTLNSFGLVEDTVPQLNAGVHSLRVDWPGDNSYNASFNFNSLTITKAVTASTVGSSTLNTQSGNNVTLTAHITTQAKVFNASQEPSGTVQFVVNGSNFGAPVAVVGGVASFAIGTATLNTSSLPTGTDNITAVYSGDSNYATSTTPTAVVVTVTGSTAPDLTISKHHSGSFNQGDAADTYAITVTNSGAGPTTAAVTVADTIPAGLTATAIAGSGWVCTLGTVSCTRSDVLAAAANYPPILVTVSVAANAAASVTNTAVVSGGGETNTSNDSANDPTTINAAATGPNLTLTLVHGGNFTVGTNGTYNFQVSNIGSSATTGAITVTFTLPTGLGFVSGGGNIVVLGNPPPGLRSPAKAGQRAQSLPTNDGSENVACSATGQIATCTFVHNVGTGATGVLNAGINSFVFPLVVSVAQAAVPNVTTVAVVADAGDAAPGSSGKTASDFTIVNVPVIPDMTITKQHTGNFTQGQTGATYTITATNSGNSPTTAAVSVVDNLPAGLTATNIAGAGWACTLGTLTCTRSDALAATTSYPVITVTVNVASNAAASITNRAVVSGGGETVTTNDTATDPTTVVVPADMTVLSAHSASFTQGQTGAIYSLTATNSGSGSTSGTVSVVDALPASLTATAMAGTGWACTVGTATCTRSDVLAAGASYPAITLTLTVANNAPASITNSVSVSGGGEINTSNDTSIDPTVVIQVGPDMTITKHHSGNFNVGQVGDTYTITATNSGGASTTGTVTVVDTLPTGLTATAISGTGWACTLGSLTCTRADALAGGASYPAITLTVNVAANAPSSLTNTAVVSGGGETDTANDSASDPTTITAPDMTILKSHTGNFLQQQVGATYTITATNSGNGPTNGTVTVVDTLPASMTATGMTGTGWACTLGTLTCTRSDVLAAAASYPPITLTVTIAANAPASVTNTAVVSGGGELNTANDSSSDPTTITPVAPDMTIAKNHSGNFVVGQVGATYTITATNSGNGSTSGAVTVVDTLPASLTATAMAGTGWVCTVATTSCTRSDVLAAAGSYPAITLTVTVATNAPASVTNSVTVSGGGETNTANDSASDPTIINAPDLTITKTHTGNFILGQVGATYTITATNSGNASTSGTVTVVDTLPATGLTATAMTGTGWACTLGTLTCTRSDALAPAASYPAITLTVTVANNAPSSVTNKATVSGGGEVNVANDVANDATGISAPDLAIAKTHAGNFAQGQVGATYTITVSNVGTGSTSGTVTVLDTLPAGLTSTAMAGTGWACTVATTTCTRSDVLANGAAYPSITLTVTVAANAAASLTNNVSVSGGGEVNVANDTAVDPTTVTTATAGLSTNALVFTAQDATVPSAAKPITITNNGTGALNFSVAPAFSGTNAGDFSAGAGTTCVAGTPVAPAGGSCIFNVVFTPGAAGARGQATLTFTDNASPANTQTVTLNGTGIDFAPAGPPTPVTVPAGQPATYTITINPGVGGFPNAVTFSATGAPAATTVAFNPPSVTPGGASASTTMTVTTTMRNNALPSNFGNHKPQFPFTLVLLWTLASALLLLMLGKMRKLGHGGRLKPVLYMAMVLFAAVGIAGCAHTPTGTPAGTTTITVTATSGNLAHSTTVTLTVQ